MTSWLVCITGSKHHALCSDWCWHRVSYDICEDLLPLDQKSGKKVKTSVNKLKVGTKWYVFICLWKMFVNLNSDRGLVTQRGLCSFCCCLALRSIHYQEPAILKSFHHLLCRTLIVRVGNQTKMCLQGHFLSFITEFIPLCRKKK